jgi:hypothetical protein
MATRFSYLVLAFRQQAHSPIQVTFVARADEVVQWAGVPRKSDELLTGYQRFRDQRRIDQEIVPFFQNERNSSPTAIIVALRHNSGLGRCTLEEADDIGVGKAKLTTLHVDVDTDRLLTDDVFEAALQYVSARLGGELRDEEGEDDMEEEEEGEEGTEEEELDDEPVTHLGSATLGRMKDALENRDYWSNADFRRAVQDYVRPGFLIDGQHRVSAAAKLGLAFVICGLYDAPWEEQVFQFTVVNLKPKRIPPSLITSIAGLSLTKEERGRVQNRLAKAGVRMDEVEIMSLVAYDERSPFAELIDMAVSGPRGRDHLLGYGGLKRIARVWYSAARGSLVQIVKTYYDVRQSEARRKWRDDQSWFTFFVDFWTQVKNTYGAEMWKKAPDNHLFTGASLWGLQDAILLEADGQMASHWNVAGKTPDARKDELRLKMREVVTSTLKYLPAEMWVAPSRRWGESDTSKGRKDLADMLGSVIDEAKKAGGSTKKWRNHEWFKET